MKQTCRKADVLSDDHKLPLVHSRYFNNFEGQDGVDCGRKQEDGREDV